MWEMIPVDRELIYNIEDISVYLGKRNANYGMRSHHFHNWYEVFIVINGECDFFVYDKAYKAGKGSTILLRPGEFHCYASKNGCEYIVIEINSGYISRYFTAAAADPLLLCFENEMLSLDENEILDCLRFASLAREKTENTESDKFLAIGCLLNLLSGKCKDSRSTKKLVRHGGSIEKLNYVINYISEHYKEIHTSEDITKNCYISKSHLFRLFRQELGQSVSDYVNNLKIHEASKLLISSNASVLNISLECGFNSTQHFYKEFKARLGCSPNEYRKHPVFNNNERAI